MAVVRGTLTIVLVLCAVSCSRSGGPRDVTVQVFVDRNSNGVWDSDDIGIPLVVVACDNIRSATCNDSGYAIFCDVSTSQHTFAIAAEDARRLADNGLSIAQSELTIDTAQEATVHFGFAASGFLTVELEANTNIVLDSNTGIELNSEEDCGCSEEG